jgi:hypothetical protein
VAVALGALGLSIRAIGAASDVQSGGEAGDLEAGPERDMLYQPAVPRGPAAMDLARSLNPDADVNVEPVRLPVSRVWLLASLLAAGAAVAGVWMLAGRDEVRTWEPRRLWTMVTPNSENPGLRRVVHVATGGVIVVTPLLLALATRVSRRPKGSVTVLGLLLVVAVAAQVWLGVLLMLDTPRGSLMRFNAANESAPPSTSPSTAPATAPATQGVASSNG